MINDLLNFLNNENIYLIANWGVIPFWLLLIISPNNPVTNFIVQSIIAPIFLASAYIFVAYNIFLQGNILDSFELYYGLDGLYSMFSNESFLLVFLAPFFSFELIFRSLDHKRFFKILGPKIFCCCVFNFNLFFWACWIIYILVYKNFLRKKN